ncbi:hypothetical protein IPP75_04640 [Candidatus Saccharibacteria bacterium]|nr:MAG: hypothetical protein IPP75_04640 [Candidatus Saccharibacteria bacterium]
MSHTPHADTLPGLEPSTPPPTERPDWNDTRMAIARLLVAEDCYQASIGETFSDITAHMRALAEPGALFSSLVGTAVQRDKGGRGKQAVTHRTASGRITTVALSAAERKLLPDYIEAYGRKASVVTRNAQNQRKGQASYDSDAPRRAAEHTLVPKMEALEIYRGTLVQQSELLKQFIEATKGRNAGLARMGSEAKMRMRGATLLEQIIPDALDAIGDQRGWGVKQEQLAQRTILARMVHFREGNGHLGYVNRLCSMLGSYSLIKQGVFTERIERASAYLEEQGFVIAKTVQ